MQRSRDFAHSLPLGLAGWKGQRSPGRQRAGLPPFAPPIAPRPSETPPTMTPAWLRGVPKAESGHGRLSSVQYLVRALPHRKIRTLVLKVKERSRRAEVRTCVERCQAGTAVSDDGASGTGRKGSPQSVLATTSASPPPDGQWTKDTAVDRLHDLQRHGVGGTVGGTRCVAGISGPRGGLYPSH